MKKINRFKHCLFFAVVLLFAITSCNKFLDVGLPKDKLVSENVFLNDEMAISTVSGIYSEMIPTSLQISSGSITVYAGLTADELVNLRDDILIRNEFYTNQVSNTNSGIVDLWTHGFKHIYKANLCIERIEDNNLLSSSVRKQLLGEARLIRAFFYSYLVNLFEGIPLITSSDYTVNMSARVSTKEEIYEQIIQDLELAKELLPIDYPSVGRVRPNKMTAIALLARVYITLGDWEKAHKFSSEVIESGIYLLEKELDDIFLANSREAIWQLMPVANGFNTTEARQFIPTFSGAQPFFSLTNSLLEGFEEGDKRKESWVNEVSVNNVVHKYPYKYKVVDLFVDVTEFYMVFRLAEQYLIRAEASARLNNLGDVENDINKLRSRAGLQNIGTLTTQTAIDAVLQERRIELFAEWGHRWFDLKRTDNASEVLGKVKDNWSSNALFFPIPLNQLLLNPNLK